jgi:hypothetical protein
LDNGDELVALSSCECVFGGEELLLSFKQLEVPGTTSHITLGRNLNSLLVRSNRSHLLNADLLERPDPLAVNGHIPWCNGNDFRFGWSRWKWGFLFASTTHHE